MYLFVFVVFIVASYLAHTYLQAKKVADLKVKQALLLAELESNTFLTTCPVNKSRLSVVNKDCGCGD